MDFTNTPTVELVALAEACIANARHRMETGKGTSGNVSPEYAAKLLISVASELFRRGF